MSFCISSIKKLFSLYCPVTVYCIYDRYACGDFQTR